MGAARGAAQFWVAGLTKLSSVTCARQRAAEFVDLPFLRLAEVAHALGVGVHPGGQAIPACDVKRYVAVRAPADQQRP